MKDFFLNNYVNIVTSIETLAALTGVFLYKKYKLTKAKFFIYFLIYVVFVERLGTYSLYVQNDQFLKFLKGTLIETNHWWFTIFWKIGGVAFFGTYYHEIITNKIFKKTLKITTFFFVISSIIHVIFNWQVFFKAWLPYIFLSGAFIIFLSVALYFIELLQSDKILHFYKSINFYISIAILFFWLVITPLVFYSRYFNTSDWNFIFLKWQIYLFANIFMYSIFTVGLIVSKPELK